ncbi:hypothetical protein [Pediococcus acidilactici]|uniref:hypothetical protein n=1 Tax=Pediococcus acidilactici TaxID=1254 RepID=UPI002936CBB3|nr:hypothetical protein [Pediococcus acidilactici]MDV2603779.1 hypothetical protein [Pediococcus acidilactici]
MSDYSHNLVSRKELSFGARFDKAAIECRINWILGLIAVRLKIWLTGKNWWLERVSAKQQGAQVQVIKKYGD